MTKSNKNNQNKGFWLIQSKNKNQKGGSIEPSYSSGGTSWGDFGSDIKGLVVYIPAAIETSIKTLESVIELPDQIASTLTSANPPNPNDVQLKGI